LPRALGVPSSAAALPVEWLAWQKRNDRPEISGCPISPQKVLGGILRCFPYRRQGGSVPDYRVYKLNHDGHISEPPHVLTCRNDEEAQREARKLLALQALEIWCGSHKVATIKPDV
jgi:hypothetical protein